MKTDTIANSNADDPTKALCSLSQNWWLFVLRGVLALIFAALAFWMPQYVVSEPARPSGRCKGGHSQEPVHRSGDEQVISL